MCQLTDRSWIQEWDHEIPAHKLETYTKSFLIANPKDQLKTDEKTTVLTTSQILTTERILEEKTTVRQVRYHMCLSVNR